MVQHKSYRGKDVDIESMAMRNEKAIAIGNMNTNARGDKLGKGGSIKKKREDIVREYYEANPKATKHAVGLRKVQNDMETKIASEVEKKLQVTEPTFEGPAESIRTTKPTVDKQVLKDEITKKLEKTENLKFDDE